MELLQRVFENLPKIILSAENALKNYESEDDAYRRHVKNPHIWIHCDRQNSKSAWTFVIERDDWPDFGWHIEFEDDAFKEMWSLAS